MFELRVTRCANGVRYLSVACVFLTLALCGCSSYLRGASGSTEVTLTANPTTIAPGGSSTLTVTALNAKQVSITGTDGSQYTLPSTGGTQVVKPSQTTKYTATATGANGTATDSATVTVNAQSSQPTVSITANPSSIAAGSSSTLTVTAANATKVTVTDSSGNTFNLSPTGGTQTVSPTATTTYTATATGPGGSATAKATVQVSAQPTVSISANPSTIAAGGSSTLTVTAANATKVTVTDASGNTFNLSATGGTQTVSPAATTTYTATATGPGGTATAQATVQVAAPPTVSITADPTTISSGNSSTLTVTATNATQVTITDPAGDSYNLSPSGGTKAVTPSATTTYTATATGPGGKATANVTVTVTPPQNVSAIDHVIFMLQENHTFDNYFGMLNPYRKKNGWNIGDNGKEYDVDGIDDKLTSISNTDDNVDSTGTHTYSLFKLTSSCVDDMSSDWLSSYGDANTYNFLATRPILMNGFVHNAAGFANSCNLNGGCSGTFTDTTGQRAMGYYDQTFLNYYYYMASQFAVSDRWFSPVASKSIDNRIAVFTGGTTQGLVKDPGNNDHLPQLNIPTIFQELDNAGVSWKIYFTDYHAAGGGYCTQESDCLANSGKPGYPVTTFSSLTYSDNYLYQISPNNPTCTGSTQPSSVVGDSTNSFCIDTTHIAPLSQYFTDLTNNALPSFVFIESGSGINDEHPGSGQEVLTGQAEVAKIVNAFMNSPEWMDSVFFLSYDEGGGPYDHVPPVPGHSNDNTDPSVVSEYPDISAIAVNPDSYKPCVPAGGTPTTHCDLASTDPGANPGDAAAQQGFAAQLGFRVPNIVISPFTRRHYVSHIPMDHTAIIKFVENRFIGPSAHLTARDAAQPNLLNFFDFTNIPWATPPVPPTPASDTSLGRKTCTPSSFAPAMKKLPVLNLFQR